MKHPVPAINAFHLLIVGPFLAYVAWHQLKHPEEQLPVALWRGLLFAAVFVMLYHGYKLALYATDKKQMLWSRFN